jgi:hypothetical protein
LQESFADILSAVPDGITHDTSFDKPATYKAAMASPYTAQWRSALEEEFSSLQELGVYKLVPRSSVPAGQTVMWGKPVFKIKRDQDGRPVRFKACYVCKGYSAIPGVDFDKTSLPTTRLESFRALAHIGAALDWEIKQLDIKATFLNGLLDPDNVCYMEQPEGFMEPGTEDMVWELQHGLYSMKQASHIWNCTLHEKMVSWGFMCLQCEHCIYYRRDKHGTVYVPFTSMTSLTLAAPRLPCLTSKTNFAASGSFLTLVMPPSALALLSSMIVRPELFPCRRLRSSTASSLILASQTHPISTPMETNLHLSRIPPGSLEPDVMARMACMPYHQLVGSLNYIACGTCPDISFMQQQLSRHLDSYGPAHWEAAKRVLCYLKGTCDLHLTLGGPHVTQLHGFTDASFATCPDTLRSVGGYCFSLGSGMITWSTRTQKTVSLSSCKAEYITACHAAQEIVWLRALLLAIGFPQTAPTPLLCDNQGSIILSGDPSFHTHVKYVNIKYHYIREHVNANEIVIRWVEGLKNIADTFTKALPPKTFQLLHTAMGLA